jgi:hypothetical protein
MPASFIQLHVYAMCSYILRSTFFIAQPAELPFVSLTYKVPWGLGYGWIMVFNVTFNNISVISRRSVLLVKETGVPRETHRPVASN